jgi:hypothetical protein
LDRFATNGPTRPEGEEEDWEDVVVALVVVVVVAAGFVVES